MTKTTPSRREREKVRYKEEILSIALQLFAQKGFYNVSMQEIADKAEFGVGTLYNFFESKEALFEELIDNTGKIVLKEFVGISSGDGNAVQRLSRFIRYQAQFQQQHGEAIKLYVSVVGVSPAFSTHKRHKIVREKLNSVFVSLIREGIENDLFRSVDPEIAAKAILTTLETITFDTAGNISEAQAAEIFQKVERLFLGGLLKPGVTGND